MTHAITCQITKATWDNNFDAIPNYMFNVKAITSSFNISTPSLFFKSFITTNYYLSIFDDEWIGVGRLSKIQKACHAHVN